MKKSNLVRGMFVGVLLFLGVQGPVATASTLQDIQNEQQETQTKLNQLNTILNRPRQQEVEECYWQLGGESEVECELTLIGVMVDSAKVEYNGKILTVELIREEN